MRCGCACWVSRLSLTVSLRIQHVDSTPPHRGTGLPGTPAIRSAGAASKVGRRVNAGACWRVDLNSRTALPRRGSLIGAEERPVCWRAKRRTTRSPSRAIETQHSYNSEGDRSSVSLAIREGCWRLVMRGPGAHTNPHHNDQIAGSLCNRASSLATLHEMHRGSADAMLRHKKLVAGASRETTGSCDAATRTVSAS